jgi:hypothetical protein
MLYLLQVYVLIIAVVAIPLLMLYVLAHLPSFGVTAVPAVRRAVKHALKSGAMMTLRVRRSIYAERVGARCSGAPDIAHFGDGRCRV